MLIRASLTLFVLLPALGAASGPLPACPESPNCVSSLATDADKRVEPLPGAGSPGDSLEALLAVLEDMPRLTFEVGPQKRQVHAVSRTRLFGFRDDLHFFIRDDGRVEVRSASRVGYWDLGTNRRRVEKLRRQLADPE